VRGARIGVTFIDIGCPAVGGRSGNMTVPGPPKPVPVRGAGIAGAAAGGTYAGGGVPGRVHAFADGKPKPGDCVFGTFTTAGGAVGIGGGAGATLVIIPVTGSSI